MRKRIIGVIFTLALLIISDGAFADKKINEKILVYNEARDVQCMNGSIMSSFKETREVHEGFNRPLEIGMKWDQDEWRTDNMYCYYVEKKEDVIVPAGTFKDCFKIVYVTCPDDEAWWYAPGIGTVKYQYRHHGTITNITHELREIVMR